MLVPYLMRLALRLAEVVGGTRIQELRWRRPSCFAAEESIGDPRRLDLVEIILGYQPTSVPSSSGGEGGCLRTWTSEWVPPGHCHLTTIRLMSSSLTPV